MAGTSLDKLAMMERLRGGCRLQVGDLREHGIVGIAA
jgi:hypothetical protein